MAEAIFGYLESLGGKEIALFLISMIPIVELRGAIPLGIAMGIPWFEVLPLAIIGNMLPVPFILWFIKYIINWLKTIPWISDLAHKIEAKLMKKSDKLKQGLGLGLLVFVAFPLPGTGAWTGAGIAALLGLPGKKSFIEILLGVIIAGVIITLLSTSVISTIKLF